MRILSARRRAIATTACVGLWAVFGYACAVEDENPAPDRARAGSTTADGASSTTPQSTEPLGIAICGKYGDVAGVNALASSILDTAKADCRIAPLFSGADAHTVQCFQAFLGGGFQCPGVSYVQGTTTDAKGNKCESPTPGIDFSAMDWKSFGDFNATPPSAAKGVLTGKGFTADELRALATVFEGKRAALLNGNVAADKYTQCAAGCGTGGEACIQPVIDSGTKDTGTDSGDAAKD